MTKPILAILAGAAAAGSIALAQAAAHPFPLGLVNAGSVRDLVLHALGTEPVPKGKIRVPILAENGVAYEVIVTKPGLPAQVPLVARGANAK